MCRADPPQLYTDRVPYYPRLVDFLIAAPHRVNAAGEIELTVAEADMLRGCDFPTAAEGPWRIPAIPSWVPLPDYLLRALPQLMRETAAVTQLTSTPAPRPPSYGRRSPDDSRSAVRLALRWRLGDALRDADRQQLLEALVRREAAPVACRRFQNSQHRLDTRRYNAALKSLIAAGFVERVKRDRVSCLVLSAEVRHLIEEAQTGVRRTPSARAKRQRERQGKSAGGTAQSGRDKNRRARVPGAKTRRRYRPRPVPDRRLFPSAWGRCLAAKRAGKARQRQARAAGICPTDAPNAARAHRRAEQERRQSTASMSVAYTAPETRSSATPARSEWFTTAGPERVTAALQRGQPVGRRERMAAERNRR